MTPVKRRTRSDGFTLVEVLVSMSVMGLIATVISSVVIVAVKNNPAVQLRTDSALTLQGITTWLPQDVDSTPPTGFNTVPTKASGCASSPGVSVLHMQWSENISGTVTQFIANYRYVASASENIIKRVTCRGTGSAPLGNTIVQRVTGPLAAMPPMWVPKQLPVNVDVTYDQGVVTIVVVELLSANNQLLRVEAAPRNPANTLPPVQSDGMGLPVVTVLATVPTTPAPTTTADPSVTTTTNPTATTTTSTTTTTTTIPVTTTTVAPCVITSAAMSDGWIKNTPADGNGKSSITVGVLAKALTITVQTVGYCTGLIASPERGAPNGELFRNFVTSNGSTYSVLFPGYAQGSPELWADGNRTITFSSPAGGPYGSVTLEVR